MKAFASIEVYNGLANRLRTIWSASAYAREYNLNLRIIWPITHDFPTAYHEILSFSHDIRIHSVELRTRRAYARFYIQRLLLSSFGIGYERRRSIPWEYTFCPKKPRVPFYWLRTCHEFFPTKEASCPFEPSTKVKNIIKRRIDESGLDISSAIGIHIRRKDHERAKRFSPLSLFIKRIRNYIDRNPNQQFLVCTDDPSEIKGLQKIFGDNHIFSSGACFLPRTDPQSAVDAMADLFMLSSCSRIIGSYQSSFSSMAGQIKSIPVEELSLQNSNRLHTDKSS